MKKILSLFLMLVLCGTSLSQGLMVSAQDNATFVAPDGGKADNDVTRSSLLGISKNFHIFANTASLKAHTNGNIAVGNLIETTSNFGTNIHEGILVKDISYIQKLGSLANSSFVNSNGNRTNKVVFGESVALTLVDNGNRVAANGIKLDHLKKDEIFQDKNGNTYIDFAEEFKQLSVSSDNMASHTQTAGVEKNFSDENNRYFDVSKAKSNSLGTVVLTKTDEKGALLDGVIFDLYQVGKNTPIKTGLKTANGGKIKVDSLEKGEYFFKETATLENYELNTKKQNFSIKDENLNSGGVIYLSLTKEEIEKDRPIIIKGINKNGPSIIVNVDTEKANLVDIGVQTKLRYTDGTERNSKETEDFSDARVLWNFTNRANGQVININRAAPFLGSILAVGNTINIGQNVDGSIVADTVNVQGGETHRWDFQEDNGNVGKDLEIKVVNKLKVSTTTTSESTTTTSEKPTTTTSESTTTTSEKSTTTTSESTTTTSEKPTTTTSESTTTTSEKPTTTTSESTTTTSEKPTTTTSELTTTTSEKSTTTTSESTTTTSEKPTTTTSESTTTTSEKPTTTTSESTTTTSEKPTTTTSESTTTTSESTTTTSESTTTTSEKPTTTTSESTTTTSESTTTTSESTTTTSEKPTTTTSESTTTTSEKPTTTTSESTTTTSEKPTTTTMEASKTTGTTTLPSDKKGKNLPKTGEESGLVTTLIGFVLLVIAVLAGTLYRKSREV